MARQGPLSGQTLNERYRLGELLGQGGFGAVYRAENLLLRRPQAIKVLLGDHFNDHKFLERFLREARTLAALDHPNIVHVDELGIQGTLIYLVMPLLSGGTLQDVIRRRSGPLPEVMVERILEQICPALDYAHRHGIVHLDLKPLNLLLHADGRLLLSDFGLAHLMEQGALEGGTSLSFGSPLYMAPEHALGHPDWRSDLYALGIMLYQLLTGQVPFLASAAQAVLFKQVSEPPPPLRVTRPDLPMALEAVVNKALVKQPEARYQSAGELLAAFKAALVGWTAPMPSSSFLMEHAPTRISPQHSATFPGMGVPPQPDMQASTVPVKTLPDHPLGYRSTVLNAPTPLVRAALAPGPKTPIRRKIWSPGFSWLFLLLFVPLGILAGLVIYNTLTTDAVHFSFPVLPLLSVSAGCYNVGHFTAQSGNCSHYPNYSDSGSALTSLVVVLLPSILLGLILLLGLFNARSRLVFAGFLLQALSVAASLGLVITMFSLINIQGQTENTPIADINAMLSTARSVKIWAAAIFVATHVSLICIAAAVSRTSTAASAKQRVPAGLPRFGLRKMSPVQAELLNILETLWQPFPSLVRLIPRSVLQGMKFVIILVIPPIILFLPTNWKQRPTIAVFLLAGWGLSCAIPFVVLLLSASFPFSFPEFGTFPGGFDVTAPYGALMLSEFLLLIGFLVLVQTERVYKKMEKQRVTQKQRPEGR